MKWHNLPLNVKVAHCFCLYLDLAIMNIVLNTGKRSFLTLTILLSKYGMKKSLKKNKFVKFFPLLYRQIQQIVFNLFYFFLLLIQKRAFSERYLHLAILYFILKFLILSKIEFCSFEKMFLWIVDRLKMKWFLSNILIIIIYWLLPKLTFHVYYIPSHS